MDRNNEVRVPIPGYEGYYDITNLGHVFRLKRPWVLKESELNHIKKPGKRRVFVRLKFEDQSTDHSVAFLLAKTFIPNPEGHRYVRFKDEDSTNINISNLFWGKSNYNIDAKESREKKTVAYEDDVYGHTEGAWMMSKERTCFINNKTAILRKIFKEKL